ncbi:MAG: DUF996 domain-containing protein [Candidatus Bathyarchaeia archaeon]
MTLESDKTLGGVGALLVVIGFLGFFASGYVAILALIGMIITLIALKGMADHYNEAGIFNNALYGVITLIIGVVAFIATLVVVILMALSSIDIDWTNPAAIQAYFTDFTNIWNIIGAAIGALVVLFVFTIVSAIFFRKSLISLSAKSGEKIFETAGLLWLIGAVLTIILIGFILIGIAWILIAVGFFSIKPTATQPPTAPPQPPPQPP